MASASTFLELLTCCPQAPCGEPVSADSAICPTCSEKHQTCPTCRATNRLRVSYCRGCGRPLEVEVWPMHPGLRASTTPRRPIRALSEHLITNLDVSVVAAPVAVEEILLIPAHEGGVIALDVADGKPMGRINTTGPIEVTPAIDSGFLFVAAGSKLSAFDLLGGAINADEIKPVWTIKSHGGAITQPLLAGRRAVYFVTHDGGRGSLHAVSQFRDGQTLWSQPLSFDSELLPPVLLGERLVLIAAGGQVKVLDPSDGQVLASEQAESEKIDMAVLPFAVEDHVLFADKSGNVFKLALEDGRVNCAYIYSLNARISCIAASREYIVLGHSAGVTLLDSHGNHRWRDNSSEAVTVPPVLTDDTFFALTDLGNAVLYDAAQGNPVERRKLFDGEGCAPPMLVGSKLAAVNSEGKVALIEWL